jgi:hypothetical protein
MIITKHQLVQLVFYLTSLDLIISNQRRRGLTPKLMSYMSATAGCDREQSEAPYYDSTTPPRFAKPHHSSLLKEEKAE